MLGGLKKGIQKVKNHFKHDKSKDEKKHKPPPTPVNSNNTKEPISNQRKKQDEKTEERTQLDHDTIGKTPKIHHQGVSPNITSPIIASPAGSCERMDDSKGERDHSDSGATAKSIRDKDAGTTEHYAQFLDHMDRKGWQKVADEFKIGYRTNAEVNRTTRYVITFNVPPDGDFYDANKVDFPGVDPKFILAAVPDNSVTSRENFWRLIYDSNPPMVIIVENYEEEKKDSKEKPFIPWTKGDSKDYGKMTVINKKLTEDGTKQAVVELVPEGCSNSVTTRIIQVLKWPETVLGDPDSSRTAAINAVRMMKDEKGPILVVCNNGCGRSAMFVMLHVILTKLNTKGKVSISEVLRSVRGDRWGAIQTVEQYLTLHLLLLDYIRSKFPRLKEQSSAMKKSLNAYVEKIKKENAKKK